MALLARTRVGRDINRHRYTRAEVEAALARPVVKDLLALIQLRNSHLAFGGRFALLASDAQTLSMQWTAGTAYARLTVNLAEPACELVSNEGSGEQHLVFNAA